MQSLLIWTGLTFMLALPEIFAAPGNWVFIGAILMIIGVVWMWIDFLSAKIKEERAREQARQ